MKLFWTEAAQHDLVRLHHFLESKDSLAAQTMIRLIVARATKIPLTPRLGAVLLRYQPRDVRRILIDEYEIRYEIAAQDLYILRVFHSKEDR